MVRSPRLASPLAALLACGDVEPGRCPGPLDASITLAALEAHLAALADIGEQHGQTRAIGTAGFAASAELVAARLAAAGLVVTRQPFTILDFELTDAPRFAQLGPDPREYVLDQDYRVARFSGSGDVAAQVVAVDLSLGPANDSTSGCEPDDFAEFVAGSVALIQRGGCYHDDKLANAAAAGAAAVVLFNQGDTPERSVLYTPRLSPGRATIPVVGVAYDLGVALDAAIAGGLELHLSIQGRAIERTTENILAETSGPASEPVIMVGAHLDSVPAGPGINDNGSGTAAVLELGLQLARCDLPRRVRLALWGAEELGLLGSEHYLATLDDADRDRIALYLNLDMIASPNPARLIYDGDGSAFGEPGPAGSAELEAAFAGWFAARGLATGETAFDGRSDYGPFIARGIPAGGLFTGAEGRKSADEVAAFGGEAEIAYDPCYHAACDDRDNYDPTALLDNTRAVAHVVETFASRVEPFVPAPAPRAHARPAPARPHAHACEDSAD